MNAEQLLEQAEGLCRPAVGRPRQVDLRRAVSGSYYALFHRLIDLACELTVGAAADRLAARQTVSRAFAHGEMKEASKSFAGGNLPAFLAGRYAGATVPTGVRRVARSFIVLQQARHDADYDRSRSFSQADAALHVATSRQAVALAADLKNLDFGRLYLICLLTWAKLRR